MTLHNLATALPASGAPTRSRFAVRGFFAYHGVWSLGVRLLRSMTLRSKILVTVGLLLLPLIWLGAGSVLESQQRLVLAEQRLQGVQLDEALHELASALDAKRLALDKGDAVDATGAKAAWQRLEADFLEANAKDPRLQVLWERAAPRLAAAAQAAPADPASRRAGLLLGLQAAGELNRAVSNASDVFLSADRRMHDNARLLLETLPRLQRHLVKLSVLLQTQADGAAAQQDLQLRQAEMVGALRLLLAQANAERAGPLALETPTSQALPGVADFLAAAQASLQAAVPTLAAQAVDTAYRPAREQASQLRLAVLAEVRAHLQAEVAHATTWRDGVVAALVFCLAVSGYMLFSFFLVMRGGLAQLDHHIQRLAGGDLRGRAVAHGGDEIANTLRATAASMTRLSDLFASVQNAVGAVTQATQQIALGNGDLQARNRDTAQSLLAVVGGAERCATQLRACSQQVETVVGTVQALRLASERNRMQVQRLRERMTALRVKSREIGEIVSLIDHIAFRTNILALNASVEASKAGEAGRGFAVVAQEVRALAQRGAESARRIGDIVSRSTDDIELGNALTEETRRTLAESDGHVDQIHTTMEHLAAMTHSGGTDTGAILGQVQQIKDSTDQNLHLVEQLAGASQALRSQSELLRHRVGQFKLV